MNCSRSVAFIIFPVEAEDDRVHPKTVIFGIEVDGNFKAYRESDLKKSRKIKDKVAGVTIEARRKRDGTVTFRNLDTGDEIVKERDFWFAWYAFHPDTGLYEP